MNFPRLFAVAAVTLVASVAAAHAQLIPFRPVSSNVRAARTSSYVVGSTTELQCVFRSNSGAPPEPYIARIQRFGLDLGVTRRPVWHGWSMRRGGRLGHGALAGHFGGVGANATVGVGFGANLLAGGSGNSISLQPLSLQGQTGLSAVAGIVNVDLRPVDLRAAPPLQAASAPPSPSTTTITTIITDRIGRPLGPAKAGLTFMAYG